MGGRGDCELYVPRCCEIFILLHFLKCGLDQREDAPPGVADSWEEVHFSAGEWKANKDHLMRYWLSLQCPNFFLFSEVFSPFTFYYLNIPLFIFLGVIKCKGRLLLISISDKVTWERTWFQVCYESFETLLSSGHFLPRKHSSPAPHLTYTCLLEVISNIIS